VTEVKFCGMTREVDVREAVRLGASYVGAILTESPRRVTPGAARALFDAIESDSVRRVGVFGNEPLDAIIDSARLSGLDIVQLHGDRNSDAQSLSRLRSEVGAEIWRVLRVRSEGLAPGQTDIVTGTDGLLLDTMTKGTLGGSGVTFRWDLVASDVRALQATTRIIVAGGLRPENVRDAIDLLAPDVVDVSSGVESQPGIKDHSRMAAFMNAVRQPPERSRA
jgi:phosphoribosylanthranilate isomerase